MSTADRDPLTLARELLAVDTSATGGNIIVDGVDVLETMRAAQKVARVVIDLTTKVERMEALEAALEKVLELHPREVVLHADPEFGQMEDDAICSACIVNHEAADWPCPNVRAITTALEATR